MENYFKLWDTVRMSELTFGAFIRRQRTAARMTQQELADAILMNNRSVSDWERGVTTPGRDALRKLARVFRIDLDEMTSYLTDAQLAQIDAIVEETPPDELSIILEEIRSEGEVRPDIARSLKDWLSGWRARGTGDQSH
jgi:transcriptional regulator with XRE-family HTH domain